MNQKTREEFVKLSKSDQKWALEVFRLLGMLGEEQQQAAVGLARTLATCNKLSRASVDGKEVTA